MGRSPFERFSLEAQDIGPERAVRTKVKAFENIVFGPCTLGRTRISCYAASERTACAAFFAESRMQLDNATNLDRKSGEHGAPVLNLSG